MCNFNLLRELIIIYGSASLSSLLFNELYFIRKTKKAYFQTRRKLKYRDLSVKSSRALYRHDFLFKETLKISRITSLIPILQIIYTSKNILDPQEVYNARFEGNINLINDEEIKIRKEFLKKIKESNVIPMEIEEKMKEEGYLPSEEDYRKVLDCNRPKRLLIIPNQNGNNKKDISKN